MMLKPWLWLSASQAHHASLIVLNLLERSESLRSQAKIPEWQSFRWRNLIFPNRLGIAGGLDKNGEFVQTWWRAGAGFLELGTVTPRAQNPNAGKIFDRSNADLALWNRMGFPNQGVEALKLRLEKIQNRATPIFVNIGKNRDTDLKNAEQDYLSCIHSIGQLADAFVINISSPNTSQLRELQKTENLKPLLQKIDQASQKFGRPFFVKLSPDQTENDLLDCLQICWGNNAAGVILTNTTISRGADSRFSTEGGVSGKPLQKLSLQALKTARKSLHGLQDRMIISVGGILTAHDVQQRLDQGADLVQVYTALAFNGLSFFKQTACAMTAKNESKHEED